MSITTILDINAETVHIHKTGCRDIAKSKIVDRDSFIEEWNMTLDELLENFDDLMDPDELGWIYSRNVLPCATI